MGNQNTNKTHEDYRLKLVSIHDNLQTMITSLPMMRNLVFRGEILIQMIIGDILTVYTMGRQDYLKKYTNESKAKSPEISGILRRDREPNIKYIKIGSLKSIQYPTGAKKKFLL